ncbi:hypothetical protein NONO_c14890 [Nocardia nova SH22a]|uniref:Uncharacterized protein n=1 Tax=Nocardia nova SH22a TaxID=1415166 RepID=W5TGB5_9NOCA|nr:hypothetical protein [Nocardia nova]AHH16291.1 hypothetical protein NONO_c14890 [Nocardia nova SH22a]
MDWGLLLGYVNSLKWPVVVAGFGMYYRRHLVGLITRVRSGKLQAGSMSAEAEFEARTVQAAVDVETTVGTRRFEYAASTHTRVSAGLTAEAQVVPSNGKLVARDDFDAFDRLLTYLEHSSPGARWAALLSAGRRQNVREAQAALERFSRLGRTDVTSTNSAEALEETNRLLTRCVYRLRAIAEYEEPLWPGASPDSRRSWDQLQTLARDARMRPRTVTAVAAAEFDKAARSWAGEYAGRIKLLSDTAERLIRETFVDLPNSGPTDPGIDGSNSAEPTEVLNVQSQNASG